MRHTCQARFEADLVEGLAKELLAMDGGFEGRSGLSGLETICQPTVCNDTAVMDDRKN